MLPCFLVLNSFRLTYSLSSEFLLHLHTKLNALRLLTYVVLYMYRKLFGYFVRHRTYARAAAPRGIVFTAAIYKPSSTARPPSSSASSKESRLLFTSFSIRVYFSVTEIVVHSFCFCVDMWRPFCIGCKVHVCV